MMNKTFLTALCTLTTISMTAKEKTGKPVYRDTKAPIEQRVEDLLSRMTIEEKVGQMNQLVGIEHFKQNSASMTAEELATNTANAFYPGMTVEDIEKMTSDGLVSSFLHVLTLEEPTNCRSSP